MKQEASKRRVIYLFPIFLILYEFAINMSNDMYFPAIPIIASDFDTSINLIQLTITSWLVGSAAIQLILGPFSDRYGRRPVIFGGGVVFLISTIVCALSHYLPILLIARFFQGMAVSSLIVAGYASINELFGDRMAVQVLSWMGMAAMVAPMVGPILGGYILHFGNWRAIFGVLFIVALGALVGLWIVMPESNLHPDTTALYPKKLIKTYRKLFFNKASILSAFPAALLYTGIIVWLTASPVVIIDVFNVDFQKYGYTQLPIFLSYMIGATVLKFLVHKVNIQLLGFIGISISTLSACILFIFSFMSYGSSIYYVLGAMSGYCLGVGFANAPLTRISLMSMKEKMGISTAFFYLKVAGLGAIGSFIVTKIYSGSILQISILITVIIVITWIMAFFRYFLLSLDENY